MMPEISGRVLRQRLQAQPRTARIPVLLMTAAYQIQTPDEFADIIAKPFEIDDLLRQVRRHISAR
jgi:CheY-like chemotaxis protein